MNLIFDDFAFSFPTTEKPVWSDKVDRWYQLDAYAYGLTEAFSRWRAAGARTGAAIDTLPDFLLLASPEASNRTDYGFASTGASSPSKFVHTLPNSRSASLLQLMEWSGPLLCLQSDPATLQTAVDEAIGLATEYSRVWILGITRNAETSFTAYRCQVLNRVSAHQYEDNIAIAARGPAAVTAEAMGGDESQSRGEIPDDLKFIEWLKNKRAREPFFLLNRVLLKKRARP